MSRKFEFGRERWEAEQEKRKLKDPCHEESEISIECQNTYGKEKCEREINNARLCKNFWQSVEQYRRENRIFPFSPPPEEREKIKKSEIERIRKMIKEQKEKKENSAKQSN